MLPLNLISEADILLFTQLHLFITLQIQINKGKYNQQINNDVIL